ncbi:hypothetical protein B0J12DRAFT_316033 [Macrophomina phaseolina]|uniref:Uncharacterized protein n=1 Tax=Macrophomina phaseolina TaxID=35725 RepID=A0ABQ8FWN4_9PEZI|nr:hypothetical protein B0J12DRAFT_316033 [Macrophomina phaseolina]
MCMRARVSDRRRFFSCMYLVSPALVRLSALPPPILVRHTSPSVQDISTCAKVYVPPACLLAPYQAVAAATCVALLLDPWTPHVSFTSVDCSHKGTNGAAHTRPACPSPGPRV